MWCRCVEITIKSVFATTRMSGGRYVIYRKLHCRYIFVQCRNIFKHFDLSLVLTFFYILYDEILSENFKDVLACLLACLLGEWKLIIGEYMFSIDLNVRSLIAYIWDCSVFSSDFKGVEVIKFFLCCLGRLHHLHTVSNSLQVDTVIWLI
jgi:hypothetical protein